MGKNVVLCCDGTANEFAKNNTNVVKLFGVLTNDIGRQVTYYHPGLGTMEPAGALTTFSRKITKLLGQAIGYGLENDIRDAYVFIMQNYVPGDRLFLFGFSRGAYTVRAVCSLLHMYGLIRSGNEPLVPYAIRLMMGVERAPLAAKSIDNYFDLAREFKATMSQDCKPHFVGVWDTVSSVGWIENPLRLPYSANNPDIQIGRHAIAIDERRAFFRTNLWHPPDAPQAGPRDLKQVWFAGVHCDIGGGYCEQESGLSKIALHWMLSEAEANGLLVEATRRAAVLGLDSGNNKYVHEDPQAKTHESLTGWWRLAEFIPKRHYNWKSGDDERRMNLFRRRTIPPRSLVHESVFERGPEYVKRLPADVVGVATIGSDPSSAAQVSSL
jgi:uncharacterized protein (DUF2235 family)